MTERSSETAETELTALASISGLERVLFGTAIKRNIRNQRSRFYKLLPRYGVAGSTRLIVANLWLLPAVCILLVSVILSVASKSTSPVRVASYVLFGIFAVCCFLMVVRAVTAARSRSTVRQS